MRATVDLYIKSVLQEASALAVPGIGTLHRRPRSPRIDTATGRILPPRVDLDFSPEVDRSVTLSDQLVTYLHLPRTEAQAIEAEVAQALRERLKSGEAYHLQGLGYLKPGQDGQPTFSPEASAWSDLAGEYFGLQPVGMAEMPIRTISLSNAENDSSMKQSGTYSPKSSRGIGWKTFLLLLLLPTLGASLVWLGPFSKPRTSLLIGARDSIAPPPEDLHTDNELPVGGEPIILSEASPVESETMEPEDATAEPATEAVATSTEPPVRRSESTVEETVTPGSDLLSSETESEGAVGHLNQLQTTEAATTASNARLAGSRTRGMPDQAEESGPTYYLVVASLTSEEGAQEKMSELRDKGYNPTQLISPQEDHLIYRIAVFGSANRSKVEEMSQALKQRGFQAPWIYTRK